jgi:phenylalanine-4-hydroxylase
MVQLLQSSPQNSYGVQYTSAEDTMWSQLYETQHRTLKGYVYEDFHTHLHRLQLPSHKVPQLTNVSAVLKQNTGWMVSKVDGLINYDEFFYLLSHRVFPSTIKLRKSPRFSKDPDIFHEIFGHAPMLLNPRYADFLQQIGLFALQSPLFLLPAIQRILWYTIEVGLIRENGELKIYGASLISSPKESDYALNSPKVTRSQFNLVDVIRSPYRADLLQRRYYIIKSFDELYQILESLPNLKEHYDEAKLLGEFDANFSIQLTKYTNANIFHENG